MNFSLIPQGIPVFDFNAFFSRHGEQNDVAAQIFHGVRIVQGHGDGHQVGHLDIMAAAVRRSRRFVGAGMIAADQASSSPKTATVRSDFVPFMRPFTPLMPQPSV